MKARFNNERGEKIDWEYSMTFHILLVDSLGRDGVGLGEAVECIRCSIKSGEGKLERLRSSSDWFGWDWDWGGGEIQFLCLLFEFRNLMSLVQICSSRAISLQPRSCRASAAAARLPAGLSAVKTFDAAA